MISPYFQVSLPRQPRVGSVLVSLAQGQEQNFAVFLVTVREGNTAEYKPCDTFTGVTGEEMVELDCNGEMGDVIMKRLLLWFMFRPAGTVCLH